MNVMELADLKSAANLAAGNWRKFQCFVWWRDRDLADADNWTIVYTHNRDSGILALSNASVYEKELAVFMEGDDPDVVSETHNHWAVGHVDGYSIRVFKRGKVTKAFKKYWELKQSEEDYPVLDEEDYSRREYEATLENIEQNAYSLKDKYVLPDDWETGVYRWLSDNESGEVESRDDGGGYPSSEAIERAMQALEYKRRQA